MQTSVLSQVFFFYLIDYNVLMPKTDRTIEIIEYRNGKSSIIITFQLPIGKWHELIGEKTIADAILDRIVYDTHRMELQGYDKNIVM
ncbi:Mobile element protein [Arcticibacter svalbardensis MN12-7]|uniref:Mobile element protein n=1 Tax=Arcticibacter svalbardensis MN12-7 TaxID=1150600 RepID=R9GW33_9SPHI|nr:ATP-binding protein [Arcticibacter svalbardensis]EOR95883.1 Mobile element protein [Arcticibacter svalbardensis MN12-7]